MVQHTEATTDFDQFYEAWLPKVQTAVHQAGFRYDYAEELVQDIFAWLWEGKYLERFDPSIAKFSTFIWGIIRLRIMDRKRELWKRNQRETVTDLTDPMYDAPTVEVGIEETELTLALKSVYDDLKQLPATETKDLARLFQDIVTMIAEEGDATQSGIGKLRGYSRQAIGQQINSLSKTKEAQRLKEFLK